MRIMGLIAAFALLLAGCASWQDNSGKVLASVAVTVDSSMKAWAIYCRDHHVDEATHTKVRGVYMRYQLSMAAAEDAYVASVKVGDKGLIKQAVAALNASKDELVLLIKLLTGNNVITEVR